MMLERGVEDGAPSTGERGSVSLVVAALAAMVLVLALGCADLAKTLVASARVQTAADAAALAAAQELALRSGADPTTIAREYAARNGGSLVDCSCTAGSADAVVRVSLPVGRLLLVGGDRTVTARARAVVGLPPPSPPPP